MVNGLLMLLYSVALQLGSWMRGSDCNCLMCREQLQRAFGYLCVQAYVLVHTCVSSQTAETCHWQLLS